MWTPATCLRNAICPDISAFCFGLGSALCSDSCAREHARTRDTKEKERERERERGEKAVSPTFNLSQGPRRLLPLVLVSQSAAKFRGEIESNRIARRRNLPRPRHVRMINRRAIGPVGDRNFIAASHDYRSKSNDT